MSVSPITLTKIVDEREPVVELRIRVDRAALRAHRVAVLTGDTPTTLEALAALHREIVEPQEG